MKQISYNTPLLLMILILSCITALNTGCRSKASGVNTVSPAAGPDLSIAPLHERTGELSNAEEWQKTRAKVAELNKRLLEKPNDIKARLQIAVIYMAEARITGEHPYYYPAINKILDGILLYEPDHFEALVYKASVKMSQHQFAEARTLAEKARTINPENAYVYGVLVDAYVELGNYEEAVKMSDKMQTLKPSLESYSRASYLREIHGDYPGAIEAMKMAVQAGLPGSEPHCWSKKTLGQLYEKTGQWEKAKGQYEDILSIRPSYAFALEGLARIEKQKNNYTKALELLDQAAAIMPEFSFQEEMADIYLLQGEKEKAAMKYKEVLKMLQEDEQSGHSVWLELARLYNKTGDHAAALKAAGKEYEQRPANIDVNLALAWASYGNKELAKAKEYIKVATKTGSRDPELLQKLKEIEKAG